MEASTRRLLVFAKAPVPGRVKTRLIPALGPEGAAALHTRLLHQTLATASLSPPWRTELWCHPGTSDRVLVAAAERHGAVLRPQRGADLGERMHNAFASALAGARQAVLIGIDCPELTVDHIHQAFKALRRGADVVLGPAIDGGYYLIGLSQPAARLFAGIEWGSNTVLASTRARARGLRLRLRELSTLRDLDRPGDLRYFPALHRDAKSEPIA